FHKLNGKLIFHPSASNHIEIGHNSSGDYLDFFRDDDGDGIGMRTTYRSDNASETFKWRRERPDGWKDELSMFHTHFRYSTRNEYSGDYRVAGNSRIEDYGAKLSTERDSVWMNGTLRGGFEWIRRDLSPKVLNSEGTLSE